MISTFFLTQSIAEHVKVALSGDGADELFASYLPHRLAQPLAYAAANPWALTEGANAGRDLLAPFECEPDRLKGCSPVGTKRPGAWRNTLPPMPTSVLCIR